MYHHHITRAVAETYAADMQRTAARHRATAPARSRHRRRAITAALAAVCAMAPAAGAGAQPTDSVIAKWRSYDRAIASASPTQRPAAVGKQDLRSPDARDAATTHKRSHGSRPTMFNASSTDLRSPDARDAADGRGTFTAPDVTVVSVPRTAPTSSGIDWADVGIGAGGVLGVALLALGGAVAVAVHRGRGARKPARIA